MAWKKLGLIFDLEKNKIAWSKSHALLPTPILLGNKIRVYFTARHNEGHSTITFVDLDKKDPTQILYLHDKPILDKGKIGTFDDCGTVGTYAIKNGDDILLYYNGYNVRNTVPWSNSIGVAVSRDGGTSFEKMFEGPIVDRNKLEPYFAITPCVIREGDLWHMWYASSTGWKLIGDDPEPVYVIKYASSANGIDWKRDNITCIHPLTPDEANARATIVKDGDTYKMWFIYRGSEDFRDGKNSYKVGYAESKDPIKWTRDDLKAGIECSPDGWDSKMLAYPAVLDIEDKRYMFYNGNGFGASGFGCAVWE